MDNFNATSISSVGVMSVIGIIAAIVLTVLICIFILPEKKREGLGKFGKVLSDLFNFKYLCIEVIMKVLYIFSTLACICWGVAQIFGFSYVDVMGQKSFHWYGIEGILTAIIGAVVIRVIYELMMLTILLVKNVIQINGKMGGDVESSAFIKPKEKEAEENQQEDVEESKEE